MGWYTKPRGKMNQIQTKMEKSGGMPSKESSPQLMLQ
jgi:hypothetical protein